MFNPKPPLLVLVTLIILWGCAPPVSIPSPTQTSINTSVPPTVLPPSPTPPALPITASTVGRLTEFQTFSSQDELVRSLAFSPDGNTLASAGGNTYDFIIRVWDVANRQFLRTLEGHTGIVWMLAFSPDGTMLASASSDGTVKVWDWNNGTLLRTLVHPHEMISVGFSPDGSTLAAGGVEEWPDAAIWTYSVGDWEPGPTYREFWNIPDLVYTPDGELLAGGGTSRNVGVWRTSDGEKLFTLSHSGQVTSLDISRDGSTLSAGLCEASDANLNCTRGAVWLWNLQTGVLSETLPDFSNWVDAVAYTPDGSALFAGSRDGTVRAYSTADLSILRDFSLPGGRGLFAISPDGRFLATLGGNESIRIWMVDTEAN